MTCPGRREAHRFPSRFARSPGAFARRLVALGPLFVALLAPAIAIAGPPYLTDDPVGPTAEPGHWEIYNFVQGIDRYGALLGETGPGQINSRGREGDLQLTAVLPMGFDNANGLSASGLRTGTGMIELAAKYKFLHQSDDGWLPDVSVFPRVLIPTQHNFGYDRTNLFLPIWAEKDFGPWSVFGGGGYELNPGRGSHRLARRDRRQSHGQPAAQSAERSMARPPTPWRATAIPPSTSASPTSWSSTGRCWPPPVRPGSEAVAMAGCFICRSRRIISGGDRLICGPGDRESEQPPARGVLSWCRCVPSGRRADPP